MDAVSGSGGERGSIAPIFLVIVSLLVIMGWILVGAAATHYLQAAHRTRDIAAGQLARAGVEAAVAAIDEGAPPLDGLAGTEATGSYAVTVTPTDHGTYTVRSTGMAENRNRTITAEVAPPPEPFAILAGGSVGVTQTNGASLGGWLTIRGDINAEGDVTLELTNSLLSLGGGLEVDGDVRAGDNANLTAANQVLAQGDLKVTGGLGANGDITLKTDSLLGVSTIKVDGPVSYRGELAEDESGLGDIDLSGPVNPGEGVTIPPNKSADVAYYEALVADLEERGALRHLSPDEGCGTISEPTRVTGDLVCGLSDDLRIEDGALLVVDGSLEADVARVQGLLYVRGSSSPSPRGDVRIDTLLLLELIHSLYPMAGGGAVVATGDIAVGEGQVASLLSFGPDYGTVLQVLALSTGPEDEADDIDYGMGGLIEGLSGKDAAPLFLYAADKGNIRITNGEGVGLVDFETLPLIAVAGGDVAVESVGLAEAISRLTLEARPEIWQQVPPFLQGLGRARVLTWAWTDS